MGSLQLATITDVLFTAGHGEAVGVRQGGGCGEQELYCGAGDIAAGKATRSVVHHTLDSLSNQANMIEITLFIHNILQLPLWVFKIIYEQHHITLCRRISEKRFLARTNLHHVERKSGEKLQEL